MNTRNIELDMTVSTSKANALGVETEYVIEGVCLQELFEPVSTEDKDEHAWRNYKVPADDLARRKIIEAFKDHGELLGTDIKDIAEAVTNLELGKRQYHRMSPEDRQAQKVARKWREMSRDEKIAFAMFHYPTFSILSKEDVGVLIDKGMGLQ